VPSVETIISCCTGISVQHRQLGTKKGKYEVRIQAKYLRETLDSDFVLKDTKHEAASVAIGIIVKSIEMVNNGERGSKSSNGRLRSKSTGKPVRAKTA